MRKLIIIIASLAAQVAFGSVDTVTVSSKITNVTVFFSGAQVTRLADLKAGTGKHVIVLDKLPREINTRSIQVEGVEGCTILSVKFQTAFPPEGTKSPSETALQRKIDTLEMKRRVISNKLTVYGLEEKLLMDNSLLRKKDDGSAIGEIRAAADFYRSRLNEIMQGKLTLSAESELLAKKIQELYVQLNGMTADKHKSYGQIQVTLDCQQEISTSLGVSYFVASAGWTPSYDFRVKSIAKPLVIVYNANVFQTSGEDWKNVKIRLSTNNPTISGEKPMLFPWYLGRVNTVRVDRSEGQTSTLKGRVVDATTNEPISFANLVVMRGGEQIAGTTSDFDGNYTIKPVASGTCDIKVTFVGYKPCIENNITVYPDKITFLNFRMTASTTNLQEVEVIDYKTPLIRKDQAASVGSITDQENSAQQYQPSQPKVEISNFISNSVKSNVANLEYQIDIPYSIPSDGFDYSLKIKEVSVPVSYVYQAVPKIDRNVYLMAEIPQWNQLNLLTGKAGIYYQGTYTGESFIDANQSADTLNLSLGRDRNIIINREGNKEINDKRLIGSNIKETVGWNITVKNNKESKIKITVLDQFPLSDKKSIEVERIESPGARVDEQTGKITWEFELEPDAKRMLSFKYSVKYPNMTTLNLN